MIVRELITRLGFDTDEKKVSKFEASVKNLTRGLAALVAGASAASAAAFKLASDTARYGDEVAKTSRVLGVGIEDLQRYRFAFDRVGVSQEQTDNALRRFNRTLGQASQGIGKGAQVMSMLGVAIRGPDGAMRSMSDVMPEVMTALRGITNESQRAAVAQELFGRRGEELVANLAGGGDELRALGAEFDALGGGLTGPQARAAEAFTDAMTNMQAALRAIRLQIGASLMPIFQDFIESFTNFLQINRELIMAKVHRAFEVLIKITRIFMTALRSIWRVVNGLANTMGGWEATLRIVSIALLSVFGAKMVIAIMGFVKAVSLANGAMAIMQIASIKLAAAMKKIPLILIIALIILLVEEIYNWMRGNDTVIGRVLGSWEDFKERLKNIFNAVVNAAKAFWNGLVDIFDMTIGASVRAFMDLWKAVFGFVSSAAKAFWGGITSIFDLAIIRPITIFWDTWKAIFSFVTEAAKSFWASIVSVFDGSIMAPIRAIGNAFSAVMDRIRSMWGDVTQWMAGRIAGILPQWLQRRLGFTADVDGSGNDSEPMSFSGDGFDMPDLSDLTPESVAMDMQSEGGDVRNTTLNNSAEINITVPPGTTREQVESIREQIDRAMERQIDNAALALEVR